MAKVLVMYNPPADPAAFDRYYFGTHVPLARRIPKVRGVKFNSGAVSALSGNAPYLICEIEFDSMADLQAALQSPEGQTTAADVANFAQAGVTILICDTRPDAPA